MKIKNICILLSVITAAAALTGCGHEAKTTVIDTNSAGISIVSDDTQEDAQVLNIGNGHTSENLDFETMKKNVTDEMMNRGYDLEGVSIDAPDDRNSFFNVIIVSNNPPADENMYVTWCSETLALLNQEAVKQDPEFMPAKDGYYGGLFDQYEVVLTATCKEDAIKKWAVYQTVKAGTHTPVKITNTEFDLSNFK